MNSPAKIETTDSRVADFLTELAEELAIEEHADLEARRPALGSGPSGYAQEAFDDDWGFRECPRDFFKAHRNHFIEKARELVASEVAE